MDTDARECGGIVTFSQEVRSYPAKPVVARVGAVALGEARVTRTS